MTNEEALFLNKKAYLVDNDGNTDEFLFEANKLACIALEKQIPKKPEGITLRKVIGWIEGRCPICGNTVFKPNGCSKCLQAIDWSDTE